MSSYFVASRPLADGAHTVHDRSTCPPGCFPMAGATEYLGEYLDATQALVVARLKYPAARGCGCTEHAALSAPHQPATSPLRP